MLQKIRNHHTVKRYFEEVSDKSDLVYFGDYDAELGERQYKGITFSPGSRDKHFVHGTVNDYDVSYFYRKSEHFVHRGESTKTTWTVCAVHLKMGGLPHIVFDAKKHDKLFTNALFIRFPAIRRATSFVNNINQSISMYFDIYMKPEANVFASSILDDSLLQQMIIAYSPYDIEIDNDVLFIFRQGEPSSTRELSTMLEEALWLAETIENRAYHHRPARSLAT